MKPPQAGRLLRKSSSKKRKVSNRIVGLSKSLILKPRLRLLAGADRE